MADTIMTLDDARKIVAVIHRNGTVNAVGWDNDGNPVGGHLTADAVGEINSIARDYADATGMDYLDARREVSE